MKKVSITKIIGTAGAILAAGAALAALWQLLKSKIAQEQAIDEQINQEIDDEIEKALSDVNCEE